MNHELALPTANYSPYRRAGSMVYFSGLIAADSTTGTVVNSYGELPADERVEAGATGQMSIDMIQGPIASQAWFIFKTLRSYVESLGGSMADVVHLNQYFTDLADFPVYSEVREKFFDEIPASTCLEVSGMLPSPLARLEVQAVAFLPEEHGS